MNILEVDQLSVWFPVKSLLLRRTTDFVRAATGVSFAIAEGRTLGLVGESGSGKTTVGKAILNLVPPTSGKIIFEGQDITNLPEKRFRTLRRRMQMIFQDPFGSLNPRWTVLQTIGEPLEIHFPGMKASDRRERVADLLQDPYGEFLQPLDTVNLRGRELDDGIEQRLAARRNAEIGSIFVDLADNSCHAS